MYDLKMKLIAIALFVVIIISAFAKTYKAGYNSGRNDEIIAQKEKTDKLRKGIVKDFRLELNAANEHVAKWKSEAVNLRKKLKVKPNKVVKYVTKIKETSDCRNLGPDFYRMHNNAAEQFTERTKVKE